MTKETALLRPPNIRTSNPVDEVTESNQRFLLNTINWMSEETDFMAYVRRPGQKTELPKHCIVLNLGVCLKVPLFQFDDKSLIPVVAQVNKLLLIDDQHWGAACWWLDGHAHTPKLQPPYTLIASNPSLLLDLAKQL